MKYAVKQHIGGLSGKRAVMGTSSIYGGPKKSNTLLPSDFINGTTDDANNTGADQTTGDIIATPAVSWSTVKADLSKIINSVNSGRSGSHSNSLRHVARQYIRASGGTNVIMSKAVSGKRAGKALQGFFGSVSSNGIRKTLEDLHIEFEGKGANEIISLLVNELAPAAVTKEDIVTRTATEESLEFVYDYIERNDLDIDCLDNMPQDLSDKSMCAFVQSYVWGSMQKDLQSRYEMYGDDTVSAQWLKDEFKDIVRSTVDVEFSKEKSIFQTQASSAIPNLMRKCFAALEGIE